MIEALILVSIWDQRKKIFIVMDQYVWSVKPTQPLKSVRSAAVSTMAVLYECFIPFKSLSQFCMFLLYMHPSSAIFMSSCHADHDECANPNHHQCDHICHNIPGSYECSCQTGFRLQPDGYTCLGQYVKLELKLFILYAICTTEIIITQ